jgi:hypothetical protein
MKKITEELEKYGREFRDGRVNRRIAAGAVLGAVLRDIG